MPLLRTSNGTYISIVYQEKWVNAYKDYMARSLTLVKKIPTLDTTVSRQALEIQFTAAHVDLNMSWSPESQWYACEVADIVSIQETIVL